MIFDMIFDKILQSAKVSQMVAHSWTIIFDGFYDEIDKAELHNKQS